MLNTVIVATLSISQPPGFLRYLNHYRCPYCQTEWQDEWDYGCNDHCPDCNKEITPYQSDPIDI